MNWLAMEYSDSVSSQRKLYSSAWEQDGQHSLKVLWGLTLSGV